MRQLFCFGAFALTILSPLFIKTFVQDVRCQTTADPSVASTQIFFVKRNWSFAPGYFGSLVIFAMWQSFPVGRAILFRRLLTQTVLRNSGSRGRGFSTKLNLVCPNCHLLQSQWRWLIAGPTPNSIRSFTTSIRNCQMRRNSAQPKEKISVKNRSWNDVKRLMSLAKPEKRRLAGDFIFIK